MKTILIIGLLFLFSSTVSGADKAEPLLVEKQHFSTENFTTVSGTTLPQVDIGWESYGELNKAKDNVILITHYFSGTSHAAGKYSADDAVAGYWDALIGPGKAIDTNKYFVISSDTLVNANSKDGQASNVCYISWSWSDWWHCNDVL